MVRKKKLCARAGSAESFERVKGDRTHTPVRAIDERSDAMSMMKVKMNHPQRKKATPLPNMPSASYDEAIADQGETMKAASKRVSDCTDW